MISLSKDKAFEMQQQNTRDTLANNSLFSSTIFLQTFEPYSFIKYLLIQILFFSLKSKYKMDFMVISN